MGLYEDLRQLSEQVKRRQSHVKGEEATKQALVLPFFQVLGFDIYDPTEIRPEYVADFAKKKSNGQFEKIDYALYVKGAPAIFVECKPLDAKPEDHEGQLARYFNATPSVKVAVITNGLCYRFFTDLRAPNMMDTSPFCEFNVLTFTEREAELLRPFTKEVFDPETVQRHAEEVISTEKVTALVDELLRNPSEPFVRFLVEKLELVPGRITPRVIERFTPIVKKAVQTALLGMMTKSIKQEIAQPPEPQPAVQTPPPPAPPAPAPSKSEGEAIVTTEEELDVFRAVSRICSESSIKQQLKYKDTVNYFGINLGRTRWFIRAFCNGPRKSLTTKLPPDQAAKLAPGFQVEAAPEVFGRSRVYFSSIPDLDKLRTLILVAYEEEAKGMTADETASS